MSAKVNLSGALPGNEDINGLDAHASELVEHPERVRLVLGWIDVQYVKDITDTGERVPVVRWRRLEVVGDADNAPPELKELALRLYEQRTGKTPLPINLVEPAAPVTSGPVES